MAVLSLPYTYADGSVLVPVSHSANIFSATGDEGLFSEPNGGLDHLNLAVGFQIQPEHVWPGEAIRMVMEERLDSIDYLSDAFADSSSADSANAYITVAGASCRFFLPYQASVVLYQWPVFAHAFRFRDGAGTGPAIHIRVLVDGSVVTHTRRPMPETAFDDNGATNLIIGRESRNARSWDMAHLGTNVAAGWHGLDVRAYMDLVDLSENLARDIGDQTVTSAYDLHHRITFGISNARVLTLL